MKEIEKEETLPATGVCLIDFYADWCGPCKVMAPVIESIEPQFEGVKFLKVNVDEGHDLSRKFSIRNIPTFVLVKDGQEISRRVGVVSAEQLSDDLLGLTA